MEHWVSRARTAKTSGLWRKKKTERKKIRYRKLWGRKAVLVWKHEVGAEKKRTRDNSEEKKKAVDGKETTVSKDANFQLP